MGENESLTRRQLEEALAASKKAEISAQRNALLHGMELKLAELIGVDGDGGEFATLAERVGQQQKEIIEMRQEIATLTLFKHRVIWTVGLITAAGSLVGTGVMFLIQHFIK